MTNPIFRPDLLRGGRILVTGGGSGLGKIMAAGLAALGATVYLCGRREDVLTQAEAEINAACVDGAGRAVGIVCDIRSPEAVDALLERIWNEGGPLTGLLNNAAGNFIARTETISVRGFDAVANTVFRGGFLVTHGCGQRWIAGGQPGSVVSILSSWIWNGGPFATASAMSKAGMHAMTQSLAVEWANKGIRLNAICPGAFSTEGADARMAAPDSGVMIGSPMGRAGRPDELVNLAAFLFAPGLGFLTGQTIAIDGAAWQATGQNFSALTSWDDGQWQQAREQAQAADARDKAARASGQ
ncbi:MAG: SDR family oxidoreductase [Pseudomonadota bacterium]